MLRMHSYTAEVVWDDGGSELVDFTVPGPGHKQTDDRVAAACAAALADYTPGGHVRCVQWNGEEVRP